MKNKLIQLVAILSIGVAVKVYAADSGNCATQILEIHPYCLNNNKCDEATVNGGIIELFCQNVHTLPNGTPDPLGAHCECKPVDNLPDR